MNKSKVIIKDNDEKGELIVVEDGKEVFVGNREQVEQYLGLRLRYENISKNNGNL